MGGGATPARPWRPTARSLPQGPLPSVRLPRRRLSRSKLPLPGPRRANRRAIGQAALELASKHVAGQRDPNVAHANTRPTATRQRQRWRLQLGPALAALRLGQRAYKTAYVGFLIAAAASSRLRANCSERAYCRGVDCSRCRHHGTSGGEPTTTHAPPTPPATNHRHARPTASHKSPATDRHPPPQDELAPLSYRGGALPIEQRCSVQGERGAWARGVPPLLERAFNIECCMHSCERMADCSCQHSQSEPGTTTTTSPPTHPPTHPPTLAQGPS